MGFFSSAKKTAKAGGLPSLDVIHRLECRACPLAEIETNLHPNMKPSGSDNPLVYICGEAPGQTEDKNNEQFIGPAGRLLRARIPREYASLIRWNNVVRCFPGETVVTSPYDVEVIYRRLYKGDLVIITTRLGYKLSVTPNHPILTRRGWVAAQALELGDNIISDRNWGKWLGFGCPNEQHEPIRIDELFCSLAQDRACERVIGGAMDFHGDGSNSDIEIVASNSKLRDMRNSSLFEFINNDRFIRSGELFSDLQFDSALLFEDSSSLCKPVPNAASVAFPSFDDCVRFCPYDLALGRAADFNSVPFKISCDSARMDLLTFGNIFTTDASHIFVDNIDLRFPNTTATRKFFSFPMCSELDVISQESSCDSWGRDKELFSKLSDAGTLGIEVDYISSLGRRKFEGHVYSLRTRSGWHLAENIVVSNTRPYKNATPERLEIEACRPSVQRDIAKTKPKAIFGFGNIPLVWATGLSGISQWRGRKTPVEIMGHKCWFYSFHHPSYLLRIRSKYARHDSDIGSEPERTFVHDLKRAFAEVPNLSEPKIWTAKEALSNIELIEASASGLEKLEQLLNWAAQQEHGGFDWETFRQRPFANDAVILSAAFGHPKKSFAWPIDHPGAKWTKSQRKKLDELIRKFLLSPVSKVSHFLNFEQEWAACFYGANVLRAGPWEDTYNQAACLDERQGDSKPGCLSLDFLVRQYFGFNLKSLSPLNKKDLRKEPLKDVLLYNGGDAKWHERLFVVQRELLHKQNLQNNYEGDLRRIPALVLSQIKGVPIYEPATRELLQTFEPKVKEAEKEIANLPETKEYERRFKRVFNPGSNKHMGEMLLKILRRAECLITDPKSGQKKIIVDEDVMSKIDHPLVHWEMKRRKAQKIISTYIIPYTNDNERGCLWADGRVHPIYNQPGTVSDRTSSEEPNVQNISKRNPEAKKVRKQIRAPKGHVFVSVDYGQIQFRAIGMTSKDKALVKYLWDRHDVHEDWTNEIAYAYPDRVGGKQYLKDWGSGGAMKTFRSDVKNQWTFPAVFGARLESRADYLKIPIEKLKPVDAKFWKEFSGIADWHERQKTFYEKHNYVLAPDGRRFRGPLSKNQYINYPIQEIEAHIVVGHGMCTLSERATRTGDLYFQPELEIHDDLSFILPDDKVDYYVEQIVSDMLSVPYDYVNVPLTVEVSVGQDLYSMQEILTAYSDEWFKR